MTQHYDQPIVINGEIQPSLRISLDFDKKHLLVQTLIHERTRIRGFGRFLDNFDPKEIIISTEAKEALLLHGEQSLKAFEFRSHTIGWGDESFFVQVPLTSIHVDVESVKDIEQFVTKD